MALSPWAYSNTNSWQLKFILQHHTWAWCLHGHTHARTHARARNSNHSHVHKHTHTCHTNTPSHTHDTQTHTHTRAHTHIHTHTHTHTNTHTHTQTHAHTHMTSFPSFMGQGSEFEIANQKGGVLCLKCKQDFSPSSLQRGKGGVGCRVCNQPPSPLLPDFKSESPLIEISDHGRGAPYTSAPQMMTLLHVSIIANCKFRASLSIFWW